MEPEEYIPTTLAEDIHQLEEKISQLFYDYGYLATGGFITIGDAYHTSRLSIEVDHNGTRHTFMAFVAEEVINNIDLAIEIDHSYGRLVIYHQKGEYHYVLTPPYDLPDADLVEQEPEVLEDYFKVIPTVRGKINQTIVTGLTFALLGGTVKAPVLDHLPRPEEDSE